MVVQTESIILSSLIPTSYITLKMSFVDMIPMGFFLSSQEHGESYSL